MSPCRDGVPRDAGWPTQRCRLVWRRGPSGHHWIVIMVIITHTIVIIMTIIVIIVMIMIIIIMIMMIMIIIVVIITIIKRSGSRTAAAVSC